MEFNFLSINIHKGLGPLGKRHTLESIKEIIREDPPELLFIQEIVGHNSKEKYPHSKKTTQYEFIARDLYNHYAYAKNAVGQYGHHGNAIFSNSPIKKFKTHDVSKNRFEQRGILHAEIVLNQKIVHAYCVHLNLLHKDRQEQYFDMAELIREMEHHDPIIIAGDFNDWNKKSSQILEDQLHFKEAYKACHQHYAKTFPSILPLLTLDRVYTKNIEILETEVFQLEKKGPLSDHCGIKAKFKL